MEAFLWKVNLKYWLSQVFLFKVGNAPYGAARCWLFNVQISWWWECQEMPWSNPDRYSCTVIRSSQPKVTHFLRSYRHWLNSIPFPNNRSNYALVSSSRISRDYLRCLNRGNFLVSFATRLVAFWCSHLRSNATSHCPASAPCCSGLFISPTWYIANEFGKVNLGSVARMM